MICVNLFGGPGIGKSTYAAWVFARLKMLGVVTELVTEYAKDLTWEQRTNTLECQPYVFGKQLWRIERLRSSGIEVVVSDSPLLMSVVYADSWPGEFSEAVMAIAGSYDNMNFLLRRMKPYSEIGRGQDEEAARVLDQQIRDLLVVENTPFTEVDGTEPGADEIVRLVCQRIIFGK